MSDHTSPIENPPPAGPDRSDATASMTMPVRLGKYAITEILGQGAMGVVYKGFDPGIQRTVAIKTIRRELIGSNRSATALLARFRNEARAEIGRASCRERV